MVTTATRLQLLSNFRATAIRRTEVALKLHGGRSRVAAVTSPLGKQCNWTRANFNKLTEQYALNTVRTQILNPNDNRSAGFTQYMLTAAWQCGGKQPGCKQVTTSLMQQSSLRQKHQALKAVLDYM